MTVNRAKHNMLNNEMIKMRKDIKNVAVKFVRKLNRDANKYLNRKNVSDTDKEKFKRRAERMKEKANIFKRLNADEVFKTVINSNWKQIGVIDPIRMEVLDKISSDSKIQQKLKFIRLEVESFTENHEKNSACLEEEKEPEQISASEENENSDGDLSEAMECDVKVSEENKNSSNEHQSHVKTNETNEDEMTNKVRSTESADDSDHGESDEDEGSGSLEKVRSESSEETNFEEEENYSDSDESVDMDWNDMMSKKKNIGDILKNVGSKYDDGEMKINHVSQELSDEYSDESSCEDDSDDGGDGFFTNTNLEKFAKKKNLRASQSPKKSEQN